MRITKPNGNEVRGTMAAETKFRKPTDGEQALLNRLLEDEFPDRD